MIIGIMREVKAVKKGREKGWVEISERRLNRSVKVGEIGDRRERGLVRIERVNMWEERGKRECMVNT